MEADLCARDKKALSYDYRLYSVLDIVLKYQHLTYIRLASFLWATGK